MPPGEEGGGSPARQQAPPVLQMGAAPVDPVHLAFPVDHDLLPAEPEPGQLGRGDPEHRDLPLLWAELYEEQTTDEPRLSHETNREVECSPWASLFDFSIKEIFPLSLLHYKGYD